MKQFFRALFSDAPELRNLPDRRLGRFARARTFTFFAPNSLLGHTLALFIFNFFLVFLSKTQLVGKLKDFTSMEEQRSDVEA